MVSTHLKNMGQLGSFPQGSGVKITNVWIHHAVLHSFAASNLRWMDVKLAARVPTSAPIHQKTIGTINQLGLITITEMQSLTWMDTTLINLTYITTCWTAKFSTWHSIYMHSLCANVGTPAFCQVSQGSFFLVSYLGKSVIGNQHMMINDWSHETNAIIPINMISEIPPQKNNFWWLYICW